MEKCISVFFGYMHNETIFINFYDRIMSADFLFLSFWVVKLPSYYNCSSVPMVLKHMFNYCSQNVIPLLPLLPLFYVHIVWTIVSVFFLYSNYVYISIIESPLRPLLMVPNNSRKFILRRMTWCTITWLGVCVCIQFVRHIRIHKVKIVINLLIVTNPKNLVNGWKDKYLK